MLLMTLWAGTAMAQDRIITRPTPKKQTTTAETKPKLKATPKPQATTGTLSITSSPSGAVVKVDDKYIGETPLTMDMQKPQIYNVTISTEGYESQTTSVTVTAGMTATCNVTLKAASVQTFNVNGVSFNMILVEEGTFKMGATSEQGSDAYVWEKPAHQVTLSSYYIGEIEVTQSLWQAVMGSNPSKFKGDNRPVERVSSHDCQTFISKLNSITGKNFRLPTEEEWEFAARGGNRSQGYKYSGSNDIDDVAWHKDNSEEVTHPVMTKSPNELGIYDMSGNVEEWTLSYWRKNYDDSKSYSSSRACRGGCWLGGAGDCRVSYRNSYLADQRRFTLGLRLAMSPPLLCP